jgi:predicted ATP-dependent endonuclease of OLD family
MKVIEDILIKNYKSFLEDEFTLEPMTAIIGANESGKTNSLKALYELSAERQKSTFDNGDFRLGSPDFPNGEIILRVGIKLTDFLIPSLSELEPALLNCKIFLSKIGKLKEAPRWKATLESPLNDIKDVIQIKNKNEFKKNAKNYLDKNIIESASKRGWLFKDANINFTSNPFFSLSKNKHVSKLEGDDKKAYLEGIILEEILSNIKVLFWKYKEDDYLHERVPIEEFVSTPNKFSSVNNIFQVGGWKISEYRRYLIDLDIVSRKNLLKNVQDEINKLIKKHWTTHSKLSITLSFEGSDLAISLDEPGHVTPPNYRSDGFKWFLTFLLFFKRHAKKSLENYILLIDEPGVFLHPRGQKDVLSELKNISKKNQIVYSTHQTFLIDKNTPDSVRIIKREPRKGVKSLYDSKVDTLKNKKNIFNDSLLRESLGFLVSDISPINEKNILVEGGFDRDLLITANQHFNIIDLNDVSIINCGMASNIKIHASLYKGNDLKVVGLYESDEGGKNAFSHAEGFEKTDFKEILPKGYETMEDVLPDAIYSEGIKEWKKIVGIAETITNERPRIKEINKLLPSDRLEKIDQKHKLEEIFLDRVRKNISNRTLDWSHFQEILNILNKKINGITS